MTERKECKDQSLAEEKRKVRFLFSKPSPGQGMTIDKIEDRQGSCLFY